MEIPESIRLLEKKLNFIEEFWHRPIKMAGVGGEE
jgi:hypothetical protein